MKHGYGVYEWKSGSSYKGQWFEGRMQVRFNLGCHPNGSVSRGCVLEAKSSAWFLG